MVRTENHWLKRLPPQWLKSLPLPLATRQNNWTIWSLNKPTEKPSNNHIHIWLRNCKIWCNTGWYKGRIWSIQLDWQKPKNLLHLWLKNCKICCTSGYNKSKTWSIQKLTEPISNLINRYKSTEQLQNLTENWLPQKQTNSSDWYDQLCKPSIRTEIQTIKRDYHVDCQISRLIQSGIKSN